MRHWNRRKLVGARYQANDRRSPGCGWGLRPDREAAGLDGLLDVLGDAGLELCEELVLLDDRERQEPAGACCATGVPPTIERLHWSRHDGGGPKDLYIWMRLRSGVYPACVQLGIAWESSAIHFQGTQDRSWPDWCSSGAGR